QSLLIRSGLSAMGGTQLSAMGGTQTADLSATGGTPSPTYRDPQIRDPQTEEAALRASPRLGLRQLTFGPSRSVPMRHRSWPPKSPNVNVGATCDCLECRAAGVTELARVKVPPDQYSTVPRWLHGDELKRWYEERERGLASMRDAVKAAK